MRTLFVGNLSPACSDGQLVDWFAQNNVKVTSVCIPQDRTTGNQKSFAFVELADGHDIEAVSTRLHHEEFLGRALTVEKAKDRKSKSRSTEPAKPRVRWPGEREKESRIIPHNWRLSGRHPGRLF